MVGFSPVRFWALDGPVIEPPVWVPMPDVAASAMVSSVGSASASGRGGAASTSTSSSSASVETGTALMPASASSTPRW